MATYPQIAKKPAGAVKPPNLDEYERACSAFDWSDARRMLDGLPGGRGLNIAHEAVDRHARGRVADHVALRWLGKDGAVGDITYARARARHAPLRQRAARARRAPRRRVFALCRTHPGAVHRRARHAQEPGRVLARCSRRSARSRSPRGSPSAGKVLVTTASLYGRRSRRCATCCRRSSTSWSSMAAARLPGDARLAARSCRRRDELRDCADRPGGPALLHFTSGTTGKPKAAMHVHGAVVAHHVDRPDGARPA